LVSMKLACLALPWGIQYRSRQTPWTNTFILQTYASPDHIMDYSHQMDYLWGPRRKHTTHRVLAVNDTWTHTHTHTHTHTSFGARYLSTVITLQSLVILLAASTLYFYMEHEELGRQTAQQHPWRRWASLLSDGRYIPLYGFPKKFNDEN
jgi:hypothetical protein